MTTRVAEYQIAIATSTVPSANTDDTVRLKVYNSGGERIENFNLDNPNRDDRERGRTDTFTFLPTRRYRTNDIEYFYLQIYGNDAWLPSAITIKTVNMQGNVDVQWSRLQWDPQHWLSTDRSDANGNAVPVYKLNKSLSRDRDDDSPPTSAFDPNHSEYEYD
ncbi:PLAT/LH2 domain-containing protein [Gimesia aquarii]|uniref:Embryo-specific protein 3, (ATS3) n=1 Tax=Gimesia aquarii TaxID=2527964 RepID=A0A517VYD8_9PLAN|nr:PLAT/LH2 domain-containing protein [Gimesia aquarii]QDT98019.1 Embryo-specific protein 3, (ATS3) [Gimesia aquarii]